MELHDSVNGKEAGSPAGSAEAPKKASLDRLELKRQWVQQAEEQQAEEMESIDVQQYDSGQSVGTSLGDLFAKLNIQ